MGDEYPGAEVIGNDLSPIQSSWVPPNVQFYVDDAEAEWVDAQDSLDFIHARHMCMAIKDWPRLLEQAHRYESHRRTAPAPSLIGHRSLKPGGWIELQELRLAVQCDDGTMPDDYDFATFLGKLKHGFSKFGINLLGMERNQELVRDAGFINVQEKVWKVPVGTWPMDRRMKMIGRYNRSVISDGLRGFCVAAFTRGLMWTEAEVEVFLVEVRKSLMNSSIHSYCTFHAVFGQKPRG